jgi:AraC-like DNA-binding protein
MRLTVIEQKVAIMSYVANHYEVGSRPSQGLSVYQCGWQRCNAGHLCGLGIRDHFAIHYILKGRGRYFAGGQTYNLQQGEGFLILPQEPVYYQADDQDPWEYVFITFDGAEALTLLRAAGLDTQQLTYRYEADDLYARYLDSAREASRSNAAQGYDVIGHFQLAMACLVRQHQEQNPRRPLSETYFREAVNYIDTHYAYDIAVSDIAHFVGIDRSYLYRIFKQQMGHSPQDWLIQVRLQHAAQLMDQTSLSLTAIAHSVGFNDLAHFSRSYRQAFDAAPSQRRHPVSGQSGNR